VALAVVSLIALGVGWNASNRVREAQQASANDSQTLRQQGVKDKENRDD